MNITSKILFGGFIQGQQNFILKNAVRNFSNHFVITTRSSKFQYPITTSVPKVTINSVQKRYVHDNFILTMKKRPGRIKKTQGDEIQSNGLYQVTAYTTAEQYDLERLLVGLQEQNLYEAQKFFSTDNLGVEQDVLYVTAKYQVETEPREIFFFREGSVILWNFNELEANNILNFLKKYERERYLKPLVKGECEVMSYDYRDRAQFKDGIFVLTKDDNENNFYEKYTFSNALAASVKLGIWEAILELYIDSMEFMTEDLKRGRKIRINRPDLLRKLGELFALRHLINLSSDLLDTPDFYWDREELEALYLQVCTYFSISRRTKVMNEKLNHCVGLAELVSSNLNDAHHIRLEWMIIILIMVEVGFEIIHYLDRYYASNDEYKIVEIKDSLNA